MPRTRKSKVDTQELPVEPVNAEPRGESAPLVDVPPLRLEWRSPAELAENPRNWRTHPEGQLTALEGVISEVGWAGACLYNETTGRLIDGHARRKVAAAQGTEKVPVLIGRWTEEQEAKILATYDPLSAMAGADAAKLEALLNDVATDNAAVQAMLDQVAVTAGIGVNVGVDDEGEQAAGQDTIPEQFQVLVECETEQQQAELLEKLTAEGLKCKSLIS